MQKFYEHRGSASSSTSKPSPSGSAEPESNVGSARSARPRHQPHAAPLITRRAGWAALQSRHRGEGSPGPSDEEMEWVREGLGGREQPQREAGEPRGRPWMTVYRTEETREEDKEERVKKYTEAPFDLDEDRPGASRPLPRLYDAFSDLRAQTPCSKLSSSTTGPPSSRLPTRAGTPPPLASQRRTSRPGRSTISPAAAAVVIRTVRLGRRSMPFRVGCTL